MGENDDDYFVISYEKCLETCTKSAFDDLFYHKLSTYNAALFCFSGWLKMEKKESWGVRYVARIRGRSSSNSLAF